MIKNTLIFLVLAFLIGCSDDPYEKYLGLWESQSDRGRYEVMEITKDGETILVDGNILKDMSFSGRKKEPMVLKKSEGQLSIESGFGSVQFGLSENENMLRVANQSYKRIDLERLKEIKADIKRNNMERENNKKLCDALTDEYRSQKAVVSEANKDWKTRNEKLKELRDEYKAKEKKIPSCNAWIM